MSGPLADDVRGNWPEPDGRPELNPAALVADVIELLRGRGLDVNTTISPTALFAASDLLRSLGVRPATAPWQTPSD